MSCDLEFSLIFEMTRLKKMLHYFSYRKGVLDICRTEKENNHNDFISPFFSETVDICWENSSNALSQLKLHL